MFIHQTRTFGKMKYTVICMYIESYNCDYDKLWMHLKYDVYIYCPGPHFANLFNYIYIPSNVIHTIKYIHYQQLNQSNSHSLTKAVSLQV